MKPEGKREKEKEKEKEKAFAGFREDAPIRPLHDCACYCIALTHSWLERMTHLPFPIGKIVGCIEDSVDRWTHPLMHPLECHCLSILASIDDKVISLIEGCARPQVKVVLSQLYTEGPVGISGRLWLKHEEAVKEDLRKAVCLANKLPLINLATPIVLSILSPSARAISDWLLKQGQIRVDEHTQSIGSSLVILKQEAGIEGQNVVGKMRKLDAGDVQYEEQNVSSVLHNEGCLEERNVSEENNDVHLKEDANADDVLRKTEDMHVDEALVEQMDVSTTEDIVEEEPSLAESVDNLNLGKAGDKIDLPHVAEEGDEYAPDVLELFETSWLLGTSAFPKNAPTSTQRKHASSSSFNIRRAFFDG